MKKTRKVTISAIAILFGVYKSCFALDTSPIVPTTVMEPVSPNYFLILSIAIGIICLLGIICLCIGIGMKNSKKKKVLSCSATTKGKIIDIVKRTYNGGTFDEPSTYMFYPKIEYNVNEQKYVKISNFGTNPSKYEIGQEVDIHYNPNKCEMYYIDGDNTQNKIGTIFIIVGSAILVMAVLVGIIGTIIINNVS